VKLVQVAGYLGSGKTTLIIRLGKSLSDSGTKIAILVNEIGEIPVDGKVLNDQGLTVKDIGGGCICCQVIGNLTRTLQLLEREQNPDIVIVEPTGLAVPGSVTDTVKLLNIDVGPTIVLFDTSRQEKLLNYETLNRLITTQLKDADIIALSKVDLVSGDMIERAEEAVSRINPKARIMKLSTRRGEGVEELVKAADEITVRI
jgi:G3E family GTPase